jgi:hypothetical protein
LENPAFYEVAAKLGVVAMTMEPAGLESSIGDAEHVCQEVRKLLTKVHSTLDRIRDISAPESTSSTMNGVLEALAVKKDGEGPLIAAVRRQVITGSESVFSMLMMHGVNCDVDKITSTYPKGKDDCDLLPKEYLKRAQVLSACMANFLAEWNARKKAAHEQRHSAKGESSGRAAGSST